MNTNIDNTLPNTAPILTHTCYRCKDDISAEDFKTYYGMCGYCTIEICL